MYSHFVFHIFIFFVLFTLCGKNLLLLAAFCNGNPSPDAKPNLYPFITTPPELVAATQYGKLFKVGPDPIYILHLWGTPYQMGYAQGTLLQAQIRDMAGQIWKYMEEEVINQLKSNLPWWLQELIADAGLQGALEAVYLMTKDYTGSYIYEEIQGIADATGIPFFRIAQMHMIGELTRGRCSLIGAWGDATVRGGGATVQLRSLDWDVKGPFKNFPLITVYHSNQPQMNSFINVGFMAWIGVLTGMSSAQLGISQIGVSYPDNTFGDEDFFGIPFIFLLRDILQWDRSYEDAVNRIINAPRTCHLILAVGDGTAKTARAFQYSHSILRVFDDRNLQPYNETWHPRIKDLVYYGMDWYCPKFDLALVKQLRAFYGNITASNIARYVTSIVQTGDLHIGIYDLTNMKMLVSFARQDGRVGPLNAYDRQFYEFDAKALFSVQPPTRDEITHPVVIN